MLMRGLTVYTIVLTLFSGLSRAWSTATCMTSKSRLTKMGDRMMHKLLRVFRF